MVKTGKKEHKEEKLLQNKAETADLNKQGITINLEYSSFYRKKKNEDEQQQQNNRLPRNNAMQLFTMLSLIHINVCFVLCLYEDTILDRGETRSWKTEND